MMTRAAERVAPLLTAKNFLLWDLVAVLVYIGVTSGVTR